MQFLFASALMVMLVAYLGVEKTRLSHIRHVASLLMFVAMCQMCLHVQATGTWNATLSIERIEPDSDDPDEPNPRPRARI